MKLLDETRFLGKTFEYRMSCSVSFNEFLKKLNAEPFVFERDGLGQWVFFCIQFTEELVIAIGAPQDNKTDSVSMWIKSREYAADAAKAIDSLLSQKEIKFIDVETGENIIPTP